MIRRMAAAGAAVFLSGCIVQAPPGYYGSAYPPPPPAPGPYPRQLPPQPPTDPPAAEAPPPEAAPPEAAPADARPAGTAPQVEAATPAPQPVPQEPRNPVAAFADESIDYGVPETGMIRQQDFDAPTPLHIKGAQTITALELDRMLHADPPPLLIDTIRGKQTVSLPGAVWLKDAGTGRHLDDDIQAWLDYQLSNLTGRDKSRALVFFCASRMCWLAHNAVLRAVDLGYKNVYWFRGGRDAWQAAQLPMTPVAPPQP